MLFTDCEERIRRYVHVEGLLKHLALNVSHSLKAKACAAVSTEKLIQCTSRSQAHKWRKYAQSENDGPDRSPRPNAS